MELRNNPQFRELMNDISDYGEDVVHKMIYSEGEKLTKLSGVALGVTEILTAFGTAPEKLTQIVEKK